jgi:hypothetical protein
MNRPLKYLPTRLTASALISTLEQIGINIPPAIRVCAGQSKEDLGYSIRAAKFSVDQKELDAALAKQELSISERLRFRFALESIGIY